MNIRCLFVRASHRNAFMLHSRINCSLYFDESPRAPHRNHSDDKRDQIPQIPSTACPFFSALSLRCSARPVIWLKNCRKRATRTTVCPLMMNNRNFSHRSSFHFASLRTAYSDRLQEEEKKQLNHLITWATIDGWKSKAVQIKKGFDPDLRKKVPQTNNKPKQREKTTKKQTNDWNLSQLVTKRQTQTGKCIITSLFHFSFGLR